MTRIPRADCRSPRRAAPDAPSRARSRRVAREHATPRANEWALRLASRWRSLGSVGDAQARWPYGLHGFGRTVATGYEGCVGAERIRRQRGPRQRRPVVVAAGL